MTIATLPTPPSRQDPTNFAIRADSFLGAIPAFATQANALATTINNNATAATNAAASAAASAISAASSLDTFDDRYLGVKASNPTVDNDGDALLTGALYWNSTSNEMRVWSGTAWFAVQSTTAATAAAASAAAAAASYDAFDDRWLGAKTSDPTVDNDGNTLQAGTVYFNSALSVMRVYTGTVWQDATTLPNGVLDVTFAPIENQTSYTLVGDTYNPALLFVYINGVLQPASRYTATNGTTISFNPALAAAFPVRILSFKSVASSNQEQAVSLGALNTINLSAGDLYVKTITGNTTFAVTNVPASGTVASFILELVNGGSATINWWALIKWPGGVPPTLTTSGRDVIGFYTYDAGTTWSGFLLGKDVK